MIIQRKKLIKKLKQYLRKEYEEDFVFTAFNQVFDIVIYRLNDDLHYKLILENEYQNIEDIKKYIRNSTYSKQFIKKKVILACYSQSKQDFSFIEV